MTDTLIKLDYFLKNGQREKMDLFLKGIQTGDTILMKKSQDKFIYDYVDDSYVNDWVSIALKCNCNKEVIKYFIENTELSFHNELIKWVVNGNYIDLIDVLFDKIKQKRENQVKNLDYVTSYHYYTKVIEQEFLTSEFKLRIQIIMYCIELDNTIVLDYLKNNLNLNVNEIIGIDNFLSTPLQHAIRLNKQKCIDFYNQKDYLEQTNFGIPCGKSDWTSSLRY